MFFTALLASRIAFHHPAMGHGFGLLDVVPKDVQGHDIDGPLFICFIEQSIVVVAFAPLDFLFSWV